MVCGLGLAMYISFADGLYLLFFVQCIQSLIPVPIEFIKKVNRELWFVLIVQTQDEYQADPVTTFEMRQQCGLSKEMTFSRTAMRTTPIPVTVGTYRGRPE